jgi:AMMECR1 domain-containing protein
MVAKGNIVLHQMERSKVIAVIALALLIYMVAPGAKAQGDPQHAKLSSQKKESDTAPSDILNRNVNSLPEVVADTLAYHFGDSKKFKSLTELANSYKIPNYMKKPAGLFVTLSRDGKTRACWGSIHPYYSDLVSATVFTTDAALTKEYRFPRIKRNEYLLLKPQVTVIRDIKKLDSIRNQNPMLYGLMVQSGNRNAVILPGEASDAYYQLVLCKLKAGIQPKEQCQMYRIKTDVFKRS